MHPFLPGPAGDAAAMGFGIAAAVLIVGGSIFLRWQRNRQRFTLMRLAMERGTTAVPGGPPFWVLSLRQGLLTLTLGIGLLAAGAALYVLTSGARPPAMASGAGSMSQQPPDLGPGRPRPGDGRGFGGPPPGDDRDFGGPPPGAGRDFGGPPPRRGPGDGAPPPRPRPNPEMDQWYRTQDERTLGLLAIAVGAVLVPLGLVRTAFARVERRYSGESTWYRAS